jgi:hypothetical protein
MSRSVKKWHVELSSKLQKAVITAIASAIITIVGGGSTFVFAKEAEFKAFVASYNFDKDMERIHWLEEQIERYRKLYGEQLEQANKEQTKRFKRWEIELRILWKKAEKYIEVNG